MPRFCLGTRTDAGGDEAISFTGKDCFAPLAMTRHMEFADTLFRVSQLILLSVGLPTAPTVRVPSTPSV